MDEIKSFNAPDDGESRRDRASSHKTMKLFDRLLEATDPEALLAGEKNLEVREAAGRLWRHHLSAEQEGFLDRAIDFEIRPVFYPGQVLLNRFEVKQRLGERGMGEVYLAYDRILEEQVALKTIAPLLASSAHIRSRFVAEVQSARRITHPNVCRIHELFEEREIPFFAMEFVAGSPIDELLLSSNLLEKTCWELATQLAEGLHAAHSVGIAHGDFKPSNVLVKPGDPPHAVIMDFGLARAFRSATQLASRSEDLGAGTLDYMAPELLTGAPTSVATDIFAFGKVARLLLPEDKLWDACTRLNPGERPASLEIIVHHLRRDNTRRYWLAGSLLAVAGAASYSFFAGRQMPLRIEDGARLLVNGFQAVVGMLPAAKFAREVLVTALQQSPRIHTVADQDLLPALRLLPPGGDLPVEGERLRKLLALQRAKYWIGGLLSERSDRYSLSVSLTRASDERLLAQNGFGDAPSISALAADVAVWIRQLAGESRQSLAANSSVVAAFTSTVPEALQKFYEAMEHYSVGEMTEAIPLLQEAVRLDPEFPQAHNYLGMCYSSLHRYAEALTHSERAMQLSANLPERERCWIEANYYGLVEDPAKALDSTRRNVFYHPDEPRFLRSYSQILSRNGASENAIGPIRKAIDLAPQSELFADVLIETLCEAGRFDEALQEYERARSQGNQSKWLESGHALALLGLERYEEAVKWYEFIPTPGRPVMHVQGAKILAGDLDSAIAALQQEAARNQVENNAIDEHQALEFLCGAYYLSDRHQQAAARLEAMTSLPAYPAFARKWQCTAFWAARLGNKEVLKMAGARLNEIATRWPNGLTHATAKHTEALARLREQAFDQGEQLLLDSMGSAFTIWTLFDLADFYASVSRFDLAEEYWRKFDARRGIVLRLWFTGAMFMAWLHWAMAARSRGNHAVARQCARRILAPWSHKNPETHVVQTASHLESQLTSP
jgi:serine/threonine protein kinase/Flp pilus assembly protein TadD